MLKKLNDQTLLGDLKTLVQQERELVTKILKYLLEVENRKLYLKRGYSSMFKFCLAELKYSNAEAQIRIQAMRLLRTLPQWRKKSNRAFCRSPMRPKFKISFE